MSIRDRIAAKRDRRIEAGKRKDERENRRKDRRKQRQRGMIILTVLIIAITALIALIKFGFLF